MFMCKKTNFRNIFDLFWTTTLFLQKVYSTGPRLLPRLSWIYLLMVGLYTENGNFMDKFFDLKGSLTPQKFTIYPWMHRKKNCLLIYSQPLQGERKTAALNTKQCDQNIE